MGAGEEASEEEAVQKEEVNVQVGLDSMRNIGQGSVVLKGGFIEERNACVI